MTLTFIVSLLGYMAANHFFTGGKPTARGKGDRGDNVPQAKATPQAG